LGESRAELFGGLRFSKTATFQYDCVGFVGLVAKSEKRFPHQPCLVMGQLNHSFLCFTLYPQTRIMANVQMKTSRKANTAAR